MRKLIMKMSMSVDGFVCGLKGEKDWVFKSSDDASRAWSLGVVADSSLIIMGRTSFEEMSPYWPTATGPFSGPMNEIPKAVFTRKGFKVPDTAVDSWAEARVFEGDLTENIKQLKQESGKPIVALGGAGFMRSLIEHGLIDEYHLAIHPVALGAGMPIFNGLSKPLDLKLISEQHFSGGIAVHTYEPV